MTTTPTAEQFLAQTDPEDDDLAEPAALDPLASIADSLRILVARVEDHADEERESDRLREAFDDLDAKAGVMAELIEEITAIVKPSTSKLANSVREAINRWSAPEAEPAPEPTELVHAAPTGGKSPCGVHYMEGTFGVDPTCPECLAAEPVEGPQAPAHDAPVEEWREYARSRGYAGPDVDQANRSQIRTMLGIAHGGEES